jgi:hypothetical protein
MISNWNTEHAWTYEIAPILEALFRYMDSLSLPETPYVTGRPPVAKKSLLKCFFLKTYFSLDSLRKLVASCSVFAVFNGLAGLVSPSFVYVFPRGEVVSGTRIFCFSSTTAQRFRSTVSPNRADRQHGSSKQSLRFTGKVGSIHPIPLV